MSGIDFDFDVDAESDLETDINKRAKLRGWFCVKLMKCSINAMPDRLFHRRGFTMYMEVKAPGEPATVQQKKRHKELRKHGIPVHVVDNREDAYDLLQ